MDNLAPGVMSNILVHGVGMALIPIMTFFMLHWMGFSGVWCAISKFEAPHENVHCGTKHRPSGTTVVITFIKIFILDAVLMVHLCLGSFIYRAWKEEVNSGFEKKALDKDD